MGKPIVSYKISNPDALDSLNIREKRVIQMRLGIGEYTRQHTLKEISESMGHHGHDWARHVEENALRKLRHPQSNCKVLVLDKDY